MTIRRLNWTDRARIAQAGVRIDLFRDGGRTWFDLRLDLSDRKLPADSLVVVEAYRQFTWQRFEFGTVSLIQKPPSTDLTEFGEAHGVKFRVKILGAGEQKGRILAEADCLIPSDPETATAGREPLLPVHGEDLGGEAWRLRLEGESEPLLLVNKRLGDWRALARLPQFRWFVFPEVLRRVLRESLARGVEVEDSENWASRWIRFAVSLPGVRRPPGEEDSEDDKEEWIDDVVQSFCRHHRFSERFGGDLLSA